jgi:hypothetical protein
MGGTLRWVAVSVAVGMAASGAVGQSFSLDGRPTGSDSRALGVPFYGNGAEDEFGLAIEDIPVLAPSPSLGEYDSGMIFSPSFPPPPGLNSPIPFAPNGFWVDAFSTNQFGKDQGKIRLHFSVDRMGQGYAGSGSGLHDQAAKNQQPGDIFTTNTWFDNPAGFRNRPVTGTGYQGVLSSAGAIASPGLNFLRINQSELGLTVVGTRRGEPTPASVEVEAASTGTHDNVNAFDFANQKIITASFTFPGIPVPITGDFAVYDEWSYFAVTPFEAAVVNADPAHTTAPISAADVFDVAPETIKNPEIAWATAEMMGLDSAGANTDSVDALIVFDRGDGGHRFGRTGVPGDSPGAEPGVDFALFSLAPGSSTLALEQSGNSILDAGDVFFTDFRGGFWVYAYASDLGVYRSPGGTPYGPSNVDALALPEPTTLSLFLIAGAAALARRRRRWSPASR